MKFSVYVAAPFEDADLARIHHERFAMLGIEPISSWVDEALGPEELDSFSIQQLRLIAAKNDRDLRAANACLVLAREKAGGEMFAEVARALSWGIPIVWYGRRTLSAYRRGVVLANDIDDAVRLITSMRDRFIDGYRGVILADVVDAAHAVRS